jgi:hypothetical protein
VHHARGLHALNYGFPIYDMIFGTFRNPEHAETKHGFWQGASNRVGSMLLGIDVTEPPTTRPGADDPANAAAARSAGS